LNNLIPAPSLAAEARNNVLDKQNVFFITGEQGRHHVETHIVQLAVRVRVDEEIETPGILLVSQARATHTRTNRASP